MERQVLWDQLNGKHEGMAGAVSFNPTIAILDQMMR